MVNGCRGRHEFGQDGRCIASPSVDEVNRPPDLNNSLVVGSRCIVDEQVGFTRIASPADRGIKEERERTPSAQWTSGVLVGLAL